MATAIVSVVRIWVLVVFACLIPLTATTAAAIDGHNLSPNSGNIQNAATSNHSNTVDSVTNERIVSLTNGSRSSTSSPAPPPPPPPTTRIDQAISKPQTVATARNTIQGAVDPVVIEAYDPFSTLVYVIVGVTIVILIYMVVKNFRRRYATARAERYGVPRRWKDQELQPLGRDDDDEDTLFEARGGGGGIL